MTDEIIPHAWPTEFSCLIYVDDLILINNYKFEVGFDTASSNPILHDVAFEKVQMFFDILMNNSILISKTSFREKKFNFGNNYVELPDMLNDQTLGAVIFSKLISLVGEDLIISYVKVSSELGRNIRFTIDDNSPELHILLPNKEDWWENDEIKNQPWWMRPDTATYDEVLSGEDIYKGEFDWNEHFGEDLERAKNLDIKKTKFEIIHGGKDEIKPNK